MLDETEFFINLNINHNLTQTDIDNIDFKNALEHQIQQKVMKVSGWRFDKINSMKIYFYKTGEVNVSNYVKIPLRPNAILNIENIDKFCFIWSILASLHPCIKIQPNRFSNYIQYFNELNIHGFDFTNEFKCSDVHKLIELNYLSINKFDLSFYQDRSKWKHKLIPVEVSKNDSDGVIDLLICKNHFALIKKNVFLGDHNKKFISRRCLNSFISENMLKIHEIKCENNDNITFRNSSETHLYWKIN